MSGPTHAEHAARAAHNQALFREVNERVKEVNEPLSEVEPTPEWVCECADPTCVERITLTMEEYEALRAEPTHFAVAPSTGHVLFEVENVIDKTDRYWIVEKVGVAAAEVMAVGERANDPE